MQANISTAQFGLLYDGDNTGNGSIHAQHLASIVSNVNTLIGATNRTVNGDSASVNLKVSAIRTGSVEIQFIIDVVINLDVQGSLDMLSNARDLLRILFGSTTLNSSHVDSLFGLYRRFRGRQPKRIMELDDQMVRILQKKGAPTLGSRIATILYSHPEIRESVEGVIAPIIDLDLERLVIRDENEILEEISQDDAQQWFMEELDTRELEILETLETIQEELRMGISDMKEQIRMDIGNWAFMSRTMTEINERLDRIEQRM